MDLRHGRRSRHWRYGRSRWRPAREKRPTITDADHATRISWVSAFCFLCVAIIGAVNTLLIHTHTPTIYTR